MSSFSLEEAEAGKLQKESTHFALKKVIAVIGLRTILIFFILFYILNTSKKIKKTCLNSANLINTNSVHYLKFVNFKSSRRK